VRDSVRNPAGNPVRNLVGFPRRTPARSPLRYPVLIDLFRTNSAKSITSCICLGVNKAGFWVDIVVSVRKTTVGFVCIRKG
jgi:hypothetical protein